MRRADRRYLKLVDQHHTRLRGWMAKVIRRARAIESQSRLDVDERTIVTRSLAIQVALSELLSSMPALPTADDVQRALERPAAMMADAARQRLVRSGFPVRTLLRRLLLPTPDPGEVVTVNVGASLAERQLLVEWATEGVSLMSRWQQALRADLPQELAEAVRRGDRWETIARQGGKRIGVTRSRMRLIARDQTAKLNGRITQDLHRRAGITEYIWRTSRDERVRSAHSEREGQQYSYDSPPPDGHPGQPIQCRCTAEPVVEL